MSSHAPRVAALLPSSCTETIRFFSRVFRTLSHPLAILPILGRMIPNMGRIASAKKSKSAKSTRPKSLVDALFTSTQQRVLGLLFGNPDRKFFATEIIGLAEAGSGAVQRELAALTQSELVTIEQLGKQKYYQANRASPIFDELRQIVLKTVGLAEPLRSALIKTKAKIELALVYGSVAKGSDKATSDIDVLVVSDDLALEQLYEAFEPAERMLGRKVSPTLYTSAEFKKRIQSKNSFIEKVLAGDQIILIGENRGVVEPR